MGVSQMPVREALKELAAEGLVEHIPYRGVRVIEFSLEDIVDLYAHRCFLEGRAARAAAQNITPAELDELRNLLAQMQEIVGSDKLAEYRFLNRQFHQVIYAASRRKYLERTLNQMWAVFPTMLCGNFAETAERALPERGANDVEEHRAVLNALERGDGDQARALIRKHIDSAGRQLLSALSDDALCSNS
jgi:DNA-binding GntR family transcriptional regulator